MNFAKVNDFLFFIFLCLSLSFVSSLGSGGSTLELKGIAISNTPTIMLQNTSKGILYDLFEEACEKLGIGFIIEDSISIMEMNSTLIDLVANRTYDFVLGYPLFNIDDNYIEEFESISRINLLRDTMIVFTPNLLQLLVVGVLKELFFVAIIILLPWFLIATMLYYLIDIRRFSHMNFFPGFYEAFLMITYKKKKMSKGAKIYSLLFYVATIIVGMLLLGDFIYVISSLLLKSDIDNQNEAINRKSSVCILHNDYLTKAFLQNRPEIKFTRADDPISCFIELNSFNVGSFLVGAARIKNFFLDVPDQNNMFDFDIRDSISMDYALLIRDDIDDLQAKLSGVFDDMKLSFLPEVIDKYEAQPEFNRIVPSSIFSDSILLIFTSLTITSSFLIFFLIILIYIQIKRPSFTHKKKRRRGNGASRYLSRQSDIYSQQPILEAEDGYDQGAEDYQYDQPIYGQQNSVYNRNVDRRARGGNNPSLSISEIQMRRFETQPKRNGNKDDQAIREANDFKRGTDYEAQDFQIGKEFENEQPHESEENVEKQERGSRNTNPKKIV